MGMFSRRNRLFLVLLAAAATVVVAIPADGASIILGG